MKTLSNIDYKGKTHWLLFSIIVIPHAIHFFGLSSSLALGLGIMCLVILLYSINSVRGQTNSIVGMLDRNVSALLIVAIIMLHLFMASLICQTDIFRAGLSMVILVLFILAASNLASVFSAMSNKAINMSVWFIFYFFCFVVVLYFSHLGPTGASGNNSGKAMFPFNEPSMFALGVMPFFLYACIYSSVFYRYAIILIFLALAVAIQNMTLVAGCLIALVTCSNNKVAIFLFVVVGVVALQFDLSYFANRVIISPDSKNLSALVYLQGWQLVDEAFGRTMGVGLGFQQMGFLPTEVPAASLINGLIDGGDLNLKDGSFLASKLLSEFGLFGVFLIWQYLKIALRAFQQLRNFALQRDSRFQAIAISYCFIVSMLLEMFVRGFGYFTPNTFLTLTALIFLHRLRKSPEELRNYVGI